eukprot:TRINITY_DN21996_c0_g1_i1.p1 TRINITY_DN21996_c0_g1~~TRINITY_DN21996_c0_g1_i1.p1  ORF type:complete len:263 (+),score=89.84 TRINITY_DN21996_c0_g1_i1:58-846(+)
MVSGRNAHAKPGMLSPLGPPCAPFAGFSLDGGFELGGETPDFLMVKAVGYAIAAGLYKRVPGGMNCGESVWCNGSWRIYSGRKGFWLISGSEQEMQRCQGYVRSATPHMGTSPDRISEWQVHTPTGWEDCSIAVSTGYMHNDSDEDMEDVVAPPSEPLTSFADSPDVVPDTDIFRLESDLSDADFDKFKAQLSPPVPVMPYASPSLSEMSDNPRTLLHFLKTPEVPGMQKVQKKPSPKAPRKKRTPAPREEVMCSMLPCMTQ